MLEFIIGAALWYAIGVVTYWRLFRDEIKTIADFFVMFTFAGVFGGFYAIAVIIIHIGSIRLRR